MLLPALLLLGACSRNSIELQPIRPTPITVRQIATAGGQGLLTVTYTQQISGKTDTVWASLAPAGGQALTNVHFLLEAFASVQDNYDNSMNISEGRLADLPLSGSAPVLLFSNRGIRLYDSLLHSVVIAHGRDSQRLSNVYTTEYILALNDKDSLLFYGRGRGYVDADGTAKLRLKMDNGNYYNVEGRFQDTAAFAGNLLNPADKKIISRLALAPVVVKPDSPIVKNPVVRDTLRSAPYFKLRLETSRDGISSLFIQLKKA